MSTQDFLFELGTEELPPKSLSTLSEALVAGITEGLGAAGLEFTEAQGYASPRRLAVLITQLQPQQADQPVEKRGPAVKAAFDKDGNPSRAATGFAASCGVDVSALETQSTPKGDYLLYRETQPGKATTTLLPTIIMTALDKLPVAKRMRWGSNRYEFVRPVKWLLALWGDQVLPMSGFGLTADNLTYGHRIHAPDAMAIHHPGQYLDRLRNEGKVMADFAARKAYIAEQVQQQAKQYDVTPVVGDDLLAEVTSLNEWPVVLSGQFEQRFLDVPAEALISSMEEHQKYFAATDSQGELVNRFFFVANLESKDPSVVVSGNEKVIRPRLADAAFFWESDQKTPLADRLPRLDNVVFQKALGSVGAKSRRISALAASMATELGSDVKTAQRGALLAKADLVTDLVFEFDNLQGLAGYYYALKDGEPEAVALAIRDQYKPGFAGDSLPDTQAGVLVALADRLDTLVGIFAIGQKPTGTKDPFALRRASLGVLRLLIEKELALDLKDILAKALAGYDSKTLSHADFAIEGCTAYILERFRAMYQDDGITPDVFYAVRALELTHPLDIDARVRGVNAFKATDIAASLCESNKRVANLLAKSEHGSAEAPVALLTLTALNAPAEQALITQLSELQDSVSVAVDRGDYAQALAELSKLGEPLDQFFIDVMVMTDDADLREQRLTLLSEVRRLFLKVADISLLQL